MQNEGIDNIKRGKMKKSVMIGVVVGIIVLAVAGWFMFSGKGNLNQQERSCNLFRGEYELRVYDSQGRVTGLVNGEQKRDIPDSFYFRASR